MPTSCTPTATCSERRARGREAARKLARKRFSPSLFVVHFGIEGTWPGIPHHMILFGPRYEGLLTDIYDTACCRRISRSTSTTRRVDRSGDGAARAFDLLRAGARSPHLGKLPIDWDEVGPMLENRILDEVARRLIPDLQERIVTKFHYAPRDFAHDLNAHLGCAFSLEPILTQSAWFRVPQPRRHDPEPLFRRRGNASGRGDSRRGRQRQGDRRLMLEARAS